jgi:tetratricopeptide (TPR) repeat protein
MNPGQHAGTTDEGLALALLKEGQELHNRRESQSIEKAMAIFDELEGRFGRVSYRPLEKIIHEAKIYKGHCLFSLNRHAEAINALDRVVDGQTIALEASFNTIIVQALLLKISCLLELKLYECALSVSDDLLKRLDSLTETEESHLEAETRGKGESLSAFRVEALRYKGTSLSGLDRKAEAVAVYDEVIDRFSGLSNEWDMVLCVQVSNSMFDEIVFLSILNQRGKAMDVCEKLGQFCIANEKRLWAGDWAHYKCYIMFQHLKEARKRLGLPGFGHHLAS